MYAAAAAKSPQSSLTLCDPIDGSPRGSSVPGILQGRVLEWGVIAFSTYMYIYTYTICIYTHIPLKSIQSVYPVQLFATPWITARRTSLSITNSGSLLKLMSIESMMPSNHLILCCSLLLPPSIFSSIKVFPNESVLCIRWPKYWSFSFNIVTLPMNIQD